MSLGMASFTVNDAIIKFVGQHMNAGQVMLVRGAMAVVLVTLFAWYRGSLIPLRKALHPMTYVRVIGEVGGTVTFLIALVHVPLALTSAILQALPLAVTMGAAVFFGEPVGWRRWLAIAAGFVGVLIIVRPGFAGFSIYSLLILVTVVFAASRDLATRAVPPEIPALMLSALTSIGITFAGAVAITPMGGWTPISLPDLLLLFCAATFVIVAYQFLILAMRTGEISFMAPFRYSGLLWAILLGFFVFGDIPDLPMIVGSTIIVASGLYTLYRERIVRKMQPVSTTPINSASMESAQT